MIFFRSIFLSLCLLVVHVSMAQGKLSIKASVDKNRILIGEPIQLFIETGIPTGSGISFNPIDTINHFEFLGERVTDSIKKDGIISIRNIYTITSFDSGRWVIPSFTLSTGVRTDTIPVTVVFSDFNPNQDYHDIKDIIEISPAKKKPWWPYAAGGVLLLVLLLLFLMRKKNPGNRSTPEMVIDPYEEAMKELALLKKEKPGAKIFYSKLSDIFRLYIFRKKGILSLQKTTGDLILRLQDLNLDKEKFSKLAQSLQLSDFVKFARFVPPADDDRNSLETIQQTIEEIERKN
ncbi:MAG: hypothetical protein IPO53_12695 [Chitinophagaceae bacterium]|nr:hypothetical protein [Chitinophagaceae bacterium]